MKIKIKGYKEEIEWLAKDIIKAKKGKIKEIGEVIISPHGDWISLLICDKAGKIITSCCC